MTSVLISSPRAARHRRGRIAPAHLVVRREDIVFQDVAPGRVGITIRVSNEGLLPSSPTTARIEAAPLGVFVPWRPLDTLDVPALAPGESIDLRTTAIRPAPRPMGPPDRIAPAQLLTALDGDDHQPTLITSQSVLRDARPARTITARSAFGSVGGLVNMISLLAGGHAARAEPSAPKEGILPADLHDLINQPNVYWAGNLNVFIGSRPVERHRAQALRIYAGRTNLAMFVVGERQSDAYRFSITGVAAGWHAALFHPTPNNAFALAVRDGQEIRPCEWLELTGTTVMILALCPPADCDNGEVHVHVTQRSSGKQGLVEFSLDPKAAGAGCYVVD